MHILFADESGTLAPPHQNPNKHFVLAGVVIPEHVWAKLAARMSLLKLRFGVNGEIKWRNFAPNNMLKENAMAHMSPSDRVMFRNELYDALTRFNSVKVIAVAAHVERAFNLSYVNSTDDLYRICYKQLTERFQYHLQDQGREVGTTINGIVVIDHRAARDDARLRMDHHSLVTGSDPNSSDYQNIVEGLFVAPSHLSVGIQFADIVAGAIYRKVEKGDDSAFSRIESALRRSKSGKVEGYGLVYWPK